jgi:hypothetical protein
MDGDIRPGRLDVETPRTVASLYPTLCSPETDQILLALVEVQAAIINPRPNASGYLQDRERGNRSYRYGTLDVILDLARPLLAAAKIITSNALIERGGQRYLLTRFIHAPSQQYLGAEFPIDVPRHAHMELKAQMTYGRRANEECLLNITSDTDSDAGAGVPDEENMQRAVAAGERVSRANSREWLLGTTWHADEATPKAAIQANAVSLLKALRANQDIFDWRFEHSKREDWAILCANISAHFAKAYGREFGTAWARPLDIHTQDELDIFRVEFDQELKPAIDQLRAAHGTACTYLIEHLIFQGKAIDQRAQLKAGYEREVGAIEQRVEEQREAEIVTHCLFDWTGERISDPQADPLKFAEAYFDEWVATDAENRATLHDNNEAALTWLGDFPEAVVILEQIAEAAAEEAAQQVANVYSLQGPGDNLYPTRQTPAPSAVDEALDGDAIPEHGEPPASFQPFQPKPFADEPLAIRVEIPRRANGDMNVVGYFAAIRDSLDAVNDRETMQVWRAENEPVYQAQGFPMGTRVKIMNAVTARSRVLGIRPDADE